jgi:glycerol-3-phosphate dehydrogenase
VAAAESYDLVVVGGGINGTGIARDAAGRGLRVLLLEQDSLAAHTSSASTKLIHGGLRYLEHYEFRLVREALIEREKLLRIAPHLISPLQFILPKAPGLRPAWMLRAGLWLYDFLASGTTLERSRQVRLRTSPVGSALREGLSVGFSYWDCRVDDSRLVIVNAKDAAERGATIAVGERLTGARRLPTHWELSVTDVSRGTMRLIDTRLLVNAAGPWVEDVARTRLQAHSALNVRLVKGSHITTRRLYEGDHAYLLQNPDGRIVFTIPYERDHTLIGTTDVPWEGPAGTVTIDAQETEYLCGTVSRYFRRAVAPADVVWSYAGIRPLCDDASANASAVSRDYTLELDAPGGGAPVLSVFGGKITTYRALAEHALEYLAPWCTASRGRWTEHSALPGGDFPRGGIEAFRAEARRRWPFLAEEHLNRLIRAYGTRLDTVFAHVRSANDLGGRFGGDLTQPEVDYLVREEWARSADDIYWRHSKVGLRATVDDRRRLESYLGLRTVMAARAS